MLGQNQVRNSKSSHLVMSVMILLSLLAFLGSASPITDNRKPANREIIGNRKIIAKRSVSFHHALQELIKTDFFSKNVFLGLINFRLQADRLSHIRLRTGEKEKPDRIKLSQTL